MNEIVFTNPEGPKVTSSQERQDTAAWALFNETWPHSVEILIIVRQGVSRAELFISSTISEVSGATWRARTDAQESME